MHANLQLLQIAYSYVIHLLARIMVSRWRCALCQLERLIRYFLNMRTDSFNKCYPHTCANIIAILNWISSRNKLKKNILLANADRMQKMQLNIHSRLAKLLLSDIKFNLICFDRTYSWLSNQFSLAHKDYPTRADINIFLSCYLNWTVSEFQSVLYKLLKHQ